MNEKSCDSPEVTIIHKHIQSCEWPQRNTNFRQIHNEILCSRDSIFISCQVFLMDNIPANSVEPEELVNHIKSQPECTLILDSRSFMSYNENHIVHSENVHCPPIVKRRSGGFVALENIVPCEVKRKQLESGIFRKIIVYDGDTCDLTSASKDSNLYSVLKSLRQQLVDKIDPGDICYLKGL